MASLDIQLAQAVEVIMMLSTSMAAMQNQIGILTQSIAQQQQAMLQPIAPIPRSLSPLSIPLPPSPPSPPRRPSPPVQGQYMFPPLIRTKELKIAAPLHFTGKHDETESFINSCTLYMNGRKSEFPDKEVKIYWILSYMTLGMAKTCRDHVVSLMYQRQHNLSTSDELSDKRTTQSLKLRTMQQGDKPADKHVQDFEKAVLEAGYDGYPLVVEFKRFLNQGLRRRLTELRPGLVTIEQWYDEAIRTDCQWRIAKAEEAFYGKVNQSALRNPPAQTQRQSSSSSALLRQTFRNLLQPYWWQQQQQNQQASSSRDPNVMDVDRNQAQCPPIKCYNCNKEGHMAHDCKSQRSIR